MLLLLLCTPLGFARLFTIIGDLVISPISARNVDEEYLMLAFEEDCLVQKVAVAATCHYNSDQGHLQRNGHSKIVAASQVGASVKSE